LIIPLSNLSSLLLSANHQSLLIQFLILIIVSLYFPNPVIILSGFYSLRTSHQHFGLQRAFSQTSVSPLYGHSLVTKLFQNHNLSYWLNYYHDTITLYALIILLFFSVLSLLASLYTIFCCLNYILSNNLTSHPLLCSLYPPGKPQALSEFSHSLSRILCLIYWKSIKSHTFVLGIVVHVSSSSYLGGRDKKITVEVYPWQS
jgi:hypothetical protein